MWARRRSTPPLKYTPREICAGEQICPKWIIYGVFTQRSDNSSKIQSINLTSFFFICAGKFAFVIFLAQRARSSWVPSGWNASIGGRILNLSKHSSHHGAADDALVNSISAGWPARPEHICGSKCPSPGFRPAAPVASCWLNSEWLWSVNHVLGWMTKKQTNFPRSRVFFVWHLFISLARRL